MKRITKTKAQKEADAKAALYQRVRDMAWGAARVAAIRREIAAARNNQAGLAWRRGRG